MYVLVLVAILLCSPERAHAVADAILGVDTTTGVAEALSAEDAGALIGADTSGLDGSFDVVNEIDGATSARPLIFGDGTRGFEGFGDATLGSVLRPFPLADSAWRCWTNFNCIIRDEEASATILTIDPDAASRLAMYQIGANYRPYKSVYIDASKFNGDGTQCPARPTIVTISNMPMPTFICTENNSSRLRVAFPMRTNWDAGAILIKLYYVQTAADTGSAAFEVAAACRALGTAFNGTYGTEVDVTDAAVSGSGAIDGTLSAAVTPNGTCAASNWFFLYIDVDATANPTTAAATLNIIGADVFYLETSLSQ